jgi:uncharacterized protein YukE
MEGCTLSNYIIKADHSRFEAAASAIESYTNTHKGKMNLANSEVTALNAAWAGADYVKFRERWNRLDDNGSVSQKMLSALEAYAKFLRYSAEKYKQAQINAVNRANGITNWWWD